MSSTPQNHSAAADQLVKSTSPPAAPVVSTPRRSEPQPVRKINTQSALVGNESPVDPAGLNRSESAPATNAPGSLSRDVQRVANLGVATADPTRKRSQFQITAVATVVGRKGDATDDDLEEISQTSDGSISPSSLSLGSLGGNIHPAGLDSSDADGHAHLIFGDMTKQLGRTNGIDTEPSPNVSQPLTINVDSTVPHADLPEIVMSPPVCRPDQIFPPSLATAQISGLAAVAALPTSLSQGQLGELSTSAVLPRCQREFRVVVVENVEYRRGRWCCVDRGEPVAPPSASHIDVSSLSSGSTDSRPPSLRFESGHLLSASHSNVPSPLAAGGHPHTVTTNLPTSDAQHPNSTDFPIGSPNESDLYLRKISHIAQIISTLDATGESREVLRPKSDAEGLDDHRGCEAPPPSPASQAGDNHRPIPSCPPPTPQLTPISTPSSSTGNFTPATNEHRTITPKELDKLIVAPPTSLTLSIEPISTGTPVKPTTTTKSNVKVPPSEMISAVPNDLLRLRDDKLPPVTPASTPATTNNSAASVKPPVVVKPVESVAMQVSPPVAVPNAAAPAATKSAPMASSPEPTNTLTTVAPSAIQPKSAAAPPVVPVLAEKPVATGQTTVVPAATDSTAHITSSTATGPSGIFGLADWFKTPTNLSYLSSASGGSGTSQADVSAGLNIFVTGPNPPGTNVVAIDNKIEQAMDLVKTHLMYAVREEVEVLKEKIGDLEKKIGRLEWENSILRESATPDVLAKLLPNGPAAPPTSTSPPAGPADSTPPT